jgi:hypothetical protein
MHWQIHKIAAAAAHAVHLKSVFFIVRNMGRKEKAFLNRDRKYILSTSNHTPNTNKIPKDCRLDQIVPHCRASTLYF